MRKSVLACVAILAAGIALAAILYRFPFAGPPPLAASHPPEPTLATAVAEAAAGPSPGCARPPRPPGRSTATALDGSGHERRYEIVVPPGYTGKTPLALIFGFHGGGGSSDGPLKDGVVEAAGEAAITVSPQGLVYDGTTGWDDTCKGADIALFDRIRTDVEANYCVDTGRRFAFGHSWGGDFATALACCRGDTLRGIAPSAATDEFKDPADFRTYDNLSCPVRSRAAIRFTHASGGDSFYPAPLFDSTSKLFRFLNACPANATPVAAGLCTTFQGCASPVTECSYPGIGHNLPPNYGTETWKFFDSLR